MSRLPTPGSDDGSWGNVLNDFLSVEHNGDGTLKTSGSLSTKADNSAVVHTTGAEIVAGIKTFTSAPVVPSNAFPESAITNLTADLGAKLRYRGAWAASTLYAINDLLTFSGTSYVVTAGFTSGTSFSLTNLTALVNRAGVYNVQAYGAKGDGTTNDTAAINATISAAFAAGVANGTYYAEIYFPPAVYLIASNPTTTGQGNAQIPLPVIQANPSGAPVGQQKFILVFKGTADATALYHWNQGAVQQAGAVLRTTYDAGPTIPSGGEVSVIGGPNPHNGFGGGTNVWDNLLVTVDGITIELPENGNICGFDFQGVAEVNVINASVLSRSSTAGASNPPSSPTWSWGLNMPQTNNNDMCNIGYYSCEGLVYGLIIQEHTQINSIRLISCYDGLVVWPSSGFPHRNVISYASIENCTKSVVFASTSITKIDIQSLDIEPTSVLNQSMVIDDPHNAAVGTIYVGANGNDASLVKNTLNGQYGVNGGSNLKVINSDQSVGAVTPPSVPSSTTALPNPWWRDAVVTLSGGTVTNITVDGKTQFTATPATVVVPSGKSITLTYSVAPTWQWTLL
ncbi:MAG TPA: glycosyl hydrolase family 28-related protein [Candidatus Saccharimonadia bacterium]|nr:glycosyl hydrolase family 28-related protein [Candidatus Saccharimonadia bacterium]